MICPRLAALALALLPAAPALAGPKVKYIAGNPAFTVEAPDGWTAEESRYNIVHPMDFRPKKGEVPYRVQMFYFPIGDTEHPRQFVREMAGEQAQQDAVTNASYDPPEEAVSRHKVALTMQTLRGRRNGVEHGYVFVYFVVQNHGYVLTVNGPAATLGQAGKVTDAIINSVRPLKGK